MHNTHKIHEFGDIHFIVAEFFDPSKHSNIFLLYRNDKSGGKNNIYFINEIFYYSRYNFPRKICECQEKLYDFSIY